MLVARRLIFCCTGFIAISMGIVMNFSISSALRPGHWVIILISVFVTSGKASMGMLRKVSTPDTRSNTAQNNMKYRFFSEKAIIALRSLFIFFKFKNYVIRGHPPGQAGFVRSVGDF